MQRTPASDAVRFGHSNLLKQTIHSKPGPSPDAKHPAITDSHSYQGDKKTQKNRELPD